MALEHLTRRRLLKAGAMGTTGAALSGCKILDGLGVLDNPVRQFMEGTTELSFRAQRALMGPGAMAREFSPSDIRQPQRPNGITSPAEPEYRKFAEGHFADYRLHVSGLVEESLRLDLTTLKGMPARTQITRHDCVEGWSCIAQWTGVPLARVLEAARPTPAARYAVFWCYGKMETFFTDPLPYYESIDMVDAYHPQTILAYGLNGGDLPEENGAPIRLRVERQLGYKMAKFVYRIELVDSFASIQGGRGGYWEDMGYAWYAGI